MGITRKEGGHPLARSSQGLKRPKLLLAVHTDPTSTWHDSAVQLSAQRPRVTHAGVRTNTCAPRAIAPAPALAPVT